MAISTLMQSAFNKSDEFVAQVESYVKRLATQRNNTWTPMDDNTRSLLSQVAKTPQSYSFPSVIIADEDWFVTYDPWAANPTQWDEQISIYVEKYWLMLTGIKEPVEPEPEPEPEV